MISNGSVRILVTNQGEDNMQRFHWTFAVGVLLVTASAVDAQVVGGVMAVTQSHMS
jgi:hypothetical protein